MSKFKDKLIKILILIIFILVTVLLILNFTIPGFHISLPFTYDEKNTSTEVIFKNINKVAALSTVEYIYKSVFPFDFIDESLDWMKLVRKRASKGYLTDAEIKSLEIFDICRSIGIDLLQSTYEFVVVSSIVEAGFNLEGEIPSAIVNIQENNINISIPHVEITRFTIEDSDSTRYSYPDIEVDPQNWKIITDFVEEKIRLRVIEDGILQNAEMRGKAFIRSILQESGWENISFIQ